MRKEQFFEFFLNISFITIGFQDICLVVYGKMTSFIHVKLAVLLLSLSLVGLAQENSTSSTGSAITQNMTTSLNLTNASCNSEFQITKSAVENILRLIHNHGAHVLVIKVSLISGNITRELKWPWANEIGRTIISLKRTTILFSESSTIPFITLNRGIKEVKIVISDGNSTCLVNDGNESELLVFDFLLHQLSHSDDVHDYKLCRINNSELGLQQYNCCRVSTGGNLTVCAEYSSLLLWTATVYTIMMVFFMLHIGLPLIVHYLRQIPKETKYYFITDSPMAVSRIFYVAFLEGSNDESVKPYYRRLTLSLTVVLIFSISYPIFKNYCLPFLLFLWAILFTVFDVLDLNKGVDEPKETENISMYDKYLTILTLPFNISFWWKKLRNKGQEKGQVESQDERGGQRERQGEEQKQCEKTKKLVKNFFGCFFFGVKYILLVLPLTFYVFGLSLTSAFKIYFSKFSSSLPNQQKKLAMICFLMKSVIFSATILVAQFFLMGFFNLLLFWIIGIYLNGSIFSPYIVPTLNFVVYSWKNWKWCVETKYLQLKTTIYDICEEYSQQNNPEQNFSPEQVSRKDYPVNVQNGTVSKALYNKIRKEVLPYNKVLFYYSVRIFFFVINFCLIVFVMMYLAQKSDIDVPAQIMSTIVISTFPLIFDTIWAKHSSETKKVYCKKLKLKLRGIMKMEKREDVVYVKLASELKQKRNDIYNWINTKVCCSCCCDNCCC